LETVQSPNKTEAASNGGVFGIPEVVGHILLAESGVGREGQVDLLCRRRAAGELAAVHPR
jgi:hypothetical protein